VGPGPVELCRLRAGSALFHRKTVQSIFHAGLFHTIWPILSLSLDCLDIFDYTQFECGTF